ncbi:uncharacterized protein LOC112567953 isoform X2 [Pomacea canaliculata]|uniref:uncharacterized protein LOC112567953 isoform X2 n=1 Tax=Pomacea canaliculata TaxID=400727 RepID=UPI000D72FB12|nr:uncharacterized protein LOC112567953 isoform X2 [Pomacea canaliculata]
MASYMITFVVIISSFIFGGFAQLQLNPNPLRLTNGAASGSLQISCGIPSGVTASKVYVIGISRYLKTAPTTEQTLAKAEDGVNQGQASFATNSGLTQNTATVSGSTTQKSMTLTLTQAKCEDAGTYVCQIPYNAAPDGSLQIKTIDVSDNFTVIVPPGNITITADPQIEVGNYLVGQHVTFSCNGMIGTYDPAIGETWQWSWQYQDYESYSWTPYQNQNDITKDQPVKGTSSCQYHQISKLIVNLTLEDSQRTYKCTVQAANNQGSSDAQYTLGIVADTDLSTPETDANSGAAKASVTGAIVGGVIGGLILIAIVIVLVYFLWYRKRSSGEKYSARDPEPKPAEPAPYTYPPASTGDVSYAKSNNRFNKNRDNKGVDNKAMDEKAEGPPRYESRKPPQYDNDYRKGGRNPGFQDDDRRAPRARTNSSDDGGTDTASVGDGNPNFGTAI